MIIIRNLKLYTQNNNCLILNFKIFGNETKFHYLLEVTNTAHLLKDKEKFDNIHYYLITDVDNKFADDLKCDDYQLFSKGKTFFKYYSTIRTHINITTEKSIILNG